MFKLSNVNKIYKNNTKALNDISLEIKEGEIVVILGPSGSGKSTLLNILGGVDKPTNGSIYFNDNRIDKLNELKLTIYRKNNIGFIFQNYNLIPNLTVKENIKLGYNLSDNPIDTNEIINIIGLTKHKNKYPNCLSGGEQQRVAIARALTKNPKVLLCDEPTGALDEKNGKTVLEILQNINNQYNTTIIIVTHNPSIANMANKIIKMNSGKIVEVKNNEKIISAKELRWI